MKIQLLVSIIIAVALLGCANQQTASSRTAVPPPFVTAYWKQVSRPIQAVSYWKTSAVYDRLVPGSVHIRYTVDRDGRARIQRVQRIRGSNEVAMRIAQQAILEAPLPKPPPEVWTWAGERPIQMELVFAYYHAQKPIGTGVIGTRRIGVAGLYHRGRIPVQ